MFECQMNPISEMKRKKWLDSLKELQFFVLNLLNNYIFECVQLYLCVIASKNNENIVFS